jgi:hypothetical protein
LKLSRADALPEDRSALPTVKSLCEAFASRRRDLSSPSNTHEPIGGAVLSEQVFECSNEIAADDALNLDPDPDLNHERRR